MDKQQAVELKQKIDQDIATLQLPVQAKVAYVSTRQGWDVKFTLFASEKQMVFGAPSEYAWDEWKDFYQQGRFTKKASGGSNQ